MRPPNRPHVQGASADFPLFSREKLLPFVSLHHAQCSGSPPHCHLLLRLPVARSCRGLLTGDALVGFPPEDPTGERPGESFYESRGCEMRQLDGWQVLVLCATVDIVFELFWKVTLTS